MSTSTATSTSHLNFDFNFNTSTATSLQLINLNLILILNCNFYSAIAILELLSPLVFYLALLQIEICSLTRELEKKLSDKYVVFIGQRRVLPKESRKSNAKLGQKRPRSRTLSAVQDATLDDLVFPSEITGRRTRVAQDGAKLGKAYLDAKDQNLLEYKLDAFSSIYRALCGKEVVFEFPVQASD